MNYGNNNYWGYENLESNSYATPNNYNYYNYSPPPPSHEPYCYNYPLPQSCEPYSYDNHPPSEQDTMQEQILIALTQLKQSSEENLKILQLQNESFTRMETSLEQINDVCGSKHEAYTFNQNSFQEFNHYASNDLDSYESKENVNKMFGSHPFMDCDHVEPKTESFNALSSPSNFCSIEYPTYSSPIDVEEDYSFCNICRCLGHEREDCPGFPYCDVMSESETSDINANPFGEEDYFHEEHSICEVHNFQDDPIESTHSFIEPLTHIEHFNEDSHRREEEIHLCFSQEKILPECDSDYKTSPFVVDVDPCQVTIESCSFSSVVSTPLSCDPPPQDDNFVNDKNVLSWGDIESYDFVGIDYLLSHNTVQIGTFLLNFISPYYVVIAHLFVGVNMCWNWIETMCRVVVSVLRFWWKDPLILNFKKRKKWRVIRIIVGVS